MAKTNQIGPNAKRLIAHKMALDAPSGFAGALSFLSSKESVAQSARASTEWVLAACQLLREAAEPNPFKNSTDDEIAAYLLEQITEKEKLNQ